MTEVLPEQALARAKYLDTYLAENKKPIGPLHGLPISVKEHVGMKGLGLNAGFVGWWDQIAEDDAHILKILYKAGCVFYVRTTQPQTLMHLDTSSNFYGESMNPFNTKLTPGGSSGGEGAIVGIRGSCMGIGTDIGGSIRGPAANNGVYGLRPSSARLPMGGLKAAMKGQDTIAAVIGPFSTSLDGIKIFMKTLIDAKPWLTEPTLLPFPWTYEQDHLKVSTGKKLKVAILWDDGVVRPQPPITRALKEVAEKLKSVPEVELVDWKPYRHDLAWEIIAGLYFCDGGEDQLKALGTSGEPLRPLSEFILKDNPHCAVLSQSELWARALARDKYRSDYAAVWNSTAISTSASGDLEGVVDVILCPTGPGSAPPRNCAKYWGYTSQWNLLDYPALVFPVTKVDPAVDVVEKDYVPRNAKDEFNYKLYEDPSLYTDAPVSLQLVGRRYEDEKVVQALEFIKEKIGLPFAEYV